MKRELTPSLFIIYPPNPRNSLERSFMCFFYLSFWIKEKSVATLAIRINAIKTQNTKSVLPPYQRMQSSKPDISKRDRANLGYDGFPYSIIFQSNSTRKLESYAFWLEVYWILEVSQNLSDKHKVTLIQHTLTSLNEVGKADDISLTRVW